MSRAIKQEASLPVQSRIDIRTLANLVTYWETNGVEIRTMSQLLSWSLELVQHLLSRSNMLPSVTESVAEAHMFLTDKGLYRPGTKIRGHMKAINAMQFENLRAEGVDLKSYVGRQHNMVHNPHSVNPPNVGSPSEKGTVFFTPEQAEQAVAKMEKEKTGKMITEARVRDKEIMEQTKYDENGLVIFPESPKAKEKTEEFERTLPVESSKPVKGGELARPVTSEETDAHIDRVLKKDKEQLKQLKNM